jgi:hypothetical protein
MMRGKGTKTVRKLKQRGKSNAKKDKKLKAHSPGKRKTTWGSTYWETRRNRSDKGGKKAKRRSKGAV